MSPTVPVLVCLISRQTMQNLLPILHYGPQRVVFLSTREEDDSRRNLTQVLESRHIPVDPPLFVNAYEPSSVSHACRKVLDHYGASSVLANLTGGTKVMSLAALRCFAAAGVPCLYTDTQNRRILYLFPEHRAFEPLDTRIDALTYLQAHGHKARVRPPGTRRSHPALAAFIGEHLSEVEPFLSRLRYEMREAPGRLRFCFPLAGKQRQVRAANLLQHATRAGLLQAGVRQGRELDVTFADEPARRYLEGEWLEDLVFQTLSRLGVDSCATNVSLGWKDAPDREMNEIDVAVVHQLRFYYVSCKTGSDPQQMKQHLYELGTLSKMAGGLFHLPILVASSAKAVPSHLRRRMEALKIAYVGPSDFPRLASRLKELLE